MSDEEIYSTLMQEQIPIAPTNEVSTIFLDGTRASLDAETLLVLLRTYYEPGHYDSKTISTFAQLHWRRAW